MGIGEVTKDEGDVESMGQVLGVKRQVPTSRRVNWGGFGGKLSRSWDVMVKCLSRSLL